MPTISSPLLSAASALPWRTHSLSITRPASHAPSGNISSACWPTAGAISHRPPARWAFTGAPCSENSTHFRPTSNASRTPAKGELGQRILEDEGGSHLLSVSVKRREAPACTMRFHAAGEFGMCQAVGLQGGVGHMPGGRDGDEQVNLSHIQVGAAVGVALAAHTYAGANRVDALVNLLTTERRGDACALRLALLERCGGAIDCIGAIGAQRVHRVEGGTIFDDRRVKVRAERDAFIGA